MKVAEALALRADLQKRLEQLKQRLVKNARIQEGDKPEEDPVELQAELGLPTQCGLRSHRSSVRGRSSPTADAASRLLL